MNYAQTKPPLRRMAGIAFVVALHAAIVYALLTGLATKVVEVIQAPIEARIIEAIKPPPPPPPRPKEIAAPTPRHVAPPPPFVPPPEVQVSTPQQNTIVTQSSVPVPSAPVAPPAPPAPAPVSASVGVVCPNSTQVRAAIRYPREAQQQNQTGDVVVAFTVGVDGTIKDLRVTQSAAPSLDRAAENAVRQFHCVAQGQDVRVLVPFAFKLD